MSRFEIAVTWTLYCAWVFSMATSLIWLESKVKANINKKYRKEIQPTIEVFGKNYKKVSFKNKFNKVV